MLKFIILFFLLLFQKHLFSIDSLVLIQKLEKLLRVEGTQKLNLLSELSFALRAQNNPKARSLGEEPLILSALFEDSTEYYKICSNLAIINAIDGKSEESIHNTLYDYVK